MPVSVPVPSPDLRLKPPSQLGSAGSSLPPSASTLSPDTPGSSKGIKSPSSVGSMPPPAGTPTRLQTIRNQTLKLHLPGELFAFLILCCNVSLFLCLGGGRNYVSLPSTGTVSPRVDDKTPSHDKHSADTNELSQQQQHNRPQLKVVIPGQKGFVPKAVGVKFPLNYNI